MSSLVERFKYLSRVQHDFLSMENLWNSKVNEFMQNMDSGTTFLLKHIKLEKNDFQDIRAGFRAYTFEHSEFEEIFNSNREDRRKIALEMIDGYGIWKDHSLEVLMVPIFFKDHWIVAIADFKSSKIRVYDTSPEDHIHTSRPWEESPYFRLIILLISVIGFWINYGSKHVHDHYPVFEKWDICCCAEYQPSDDDKTKSGVYVMAIIFLLVNEKYDTIEEISEVILPDMLPLVCAEIMTAFMDHSIQVPPLEESETQVSHHNVKSIREATRKSQRLQQKSGVQRKELDENIETFKWGKGLYYWQEINEE
ncbi:hypothetical protein K435DRAFT_853116 [Dendrothele bispora CBS 962.96]|uniref:Ubiquitin-like protease family profile domain-containing protein n=1 Tax=Dendrothele bispora (strain CBS 962.96) TaxID=1314807 RepID=A0A4S8MHW1_DENBC|nr:hypothetical protein K435DRAFT_853116 [Dendrothele bispora CBS 962.96]